MLHGLGSNGDDLIMLADLLGETFPDTAFHSPNAPHPFSEAAFGFEWFSRGGGIDREEGVKAVAPTVNGYVDELLAEYGLGAGRCVLLGFSQGTITSLYAAPRRDTQLAGVIGFSGLLVARPDMENEISSKPPTLLVHGSDDAVLPAAESERAAAVLEQAGFPVQLHVLPGIGHTIDQRGLNLASGFLKEVWG